MATRKRNDEFRNKQNRALRAKRSENVEKRENLKGEHLIDAKNQILIISENLISRHLAKVKRVTLQLVLEVNRNVQIRKRSLMSG